MQINAVEKTNSHTPFTTTEMRWLWSQSADVYKIILIQTYTGMRMSELAGIRMENVHLKEQYMIGGIKTAAGKNRIIPIADCILPLVQHFYDISRFSHHPYLIMPDKQRRLLTTDGVVNIDKLYRMFFPEHSSHDARHTFISLCSNYNVPDPLVKKIVGHAGNDVTMDVYTHKSVVQLLDAVNSLPHGSKMTVSPEEKSDSSRVATG